MTKKILAFGASSSTQSINKKLANWAAHQLSNVDITLLDLNDFEMPIFSVDSQNEPGIPELAYQFKQHVLDSDGIIISFAEHNGSYATAFKNIFDWISRIGKDIWGNKPMFLLATSPGGRGGKTVLGTATASFQFMNSNTISSFSLPSFNQNFSEEEGIINEEFLNDFKSQLNLFVNSI